MLATPTSQQASPNRLLRVTTLRNQYFALRHGQSQANVAKIIASSPNVACHRYGLSDLGKEQAQEAGQQILHQYQEPPSGGVFDGLVILTSDLLRAKETAEIAAAAAKSSSSISLHENAVVVDERLRERDFGEWDGTSDTNYPNVWKDDADDANHTIGNVESVNRVMSRTTDFILDWDARFQNCMIVCVAHGDVLQILQTAFAKLDGSRHRTLDHLETGKLRRLQLGP